MRLIGLAVVLSVSLVLIPFAGEAQQTRKIYRIGIIDNEASLEAPRLAAFRNELRNLGWVEGSNLVIEARIGAEAQFPVFAGELAGLGLDLIFAAKTQAAFALGVSPGLSRSLSPWRRIP